MNITENDRHLYLNALNFLVERFEIAHEFVRHNGLSSLPMEQMTDLIIVGVKEWLQTDMGENWMGLLGYCKVNTWDARASVTISGFLLPTAVCPSCSGTFLESHGTYCEKCGTYVCSPCISIVDPIYQIGWCSNCVEQGSLTNLMIYNE